MTWYFISYAWQHVGESNWNMSEDIIDIHPLEWLVKVRRDMEKHYKEAEKAGRRCRYDEYYLVFWSEIPEELAKKFKDEVG